MSPVALNTYYALQKFTSKLKSLKHKIFGSLQNQASCPPLKSPYPGQGSSLTAWPCPLQVVPNIKEIYWVAPSPPREGSRGCRLQEFKGTASVWLREKREEWRERGGKKDGKVRHVRSKNELEKQKKGRSEEGKERGRDGGN